MECCCFPFEAQFEKLLFLCATLSRLLHPNFTLQKWVKTRKFHVLNASGTACQSTCYQSFWDENFSFIWASKGEKFYVRCQSKRKGQKRNCALRRDDKQKRPISKVFCLRMSFCNHDQPDSLSLVYLLLFSCRSSPWEIKELIRAAEKKKLLNQ